MSKTNPKNAGRTPKYRPDVKTKTAEAEFMELLKQWKDENS